MTTEQITETVLRNMKNKLTIDGMPESYYDWENTDKKIVEDTIKETLKIVEEYY